MTDRLKIALAQMNQRVGDLEGNAAAMLEMRKRARDADLLLCPELQLIGYPPEDLVLKPEFVRRAHECTDKLVAATVEPGPAMLIGTVTREGGLLYNTMLLADGGRVIGRTFKHELPNYGTFDEKRIFAPGPLPSPIEWRGIKLGVPICEDMWLEPVCARLAELGAELFLVPHGSPYELDKIDTRERLARARTTSTGLPLVFLNRHQRLGPRGRWLEVRDSCPPPARCLSRGRLSGDDAGPPRLCGAERLQGRDPRSFRWDR
jgi:NAD+ synthase